MNGTYIGSFQAVVKARSVGNRRLLEINASTEEPDSEGDVILQSALLYSADDFVRSGILDLDHLSEIGHRLGIQNPANFIIGVPFAVSDGGSGRTVVSGELHRGRPAADDIWSALTAQPPIIYRASIYGFPDVGGVIDARNYPGDRADLRGATRYLVKGLSWRSLALTRSPVNTSVLPVRVIS